MSVVDSVSDAIGSAGTTTGSLTGSGGPGVRDPVVEPEGAGGVVGRATGGFFFPHAPTISNVTIATTTTVRLCFIVSLILMLSAFTFSFWGRTLEMRLLRPVRVSVHPLTCDLTQVLAITIDQKNLFLAGACRRKRKVPTVR